nr:hypothetical protein [Sphingobacterium sp. T2]
MTKAGAFKSVAKEFNLFKLHTHTHLYTSDSVVSDFPGRIFKIENLYSLSEFKKLSPFAKANVATKNFPMKVEDIRKRFKIKDGGEDYLFFATDYADNLIVIHGKKLS